MKRILQSDLNKALKQGDRLKVSVLRMLLASLHNAEIDKRGPLSNEEVYRVIHREVKRREEAAESFRRGNRPDRGEEEDKEAAILSHYLPAPLTDQEVISIIDQVLGKYPKKAGFGLVMSEVIAQTRGRADGKRVAELVRERLG
jgi:hypothetical protein